MRQGMESDVKLAFLATCRHPGGLDCPVQDAHGVIDLIDEAASGFGQADAARVAVEEDDAEFSLQRLDPRAHTRLTGPERLRRTMEAEIFRDSEGLDEGYHRYAYAGKRQRGIRWPISLLTPPHSYLFTVSNCLAAGGARLRMPAIARTRPIQRGEISPYPA